MGTHNGTVVPYCYLRRHVNKLYWSGLLSHFAHGRNEETWRLHKTRVFNAPNREI